jgi:hypothetical protein
MTMRVSLKQHDYFGKRALSKSLIKDVKRVMLSDSIVLADTGILISRAVKADRNLHKE